LATRNVGRVEFRCETKDGKTGRVAINGTTYDLADGNLFVVSAAGDHSQVKQLRRNLSELKFERENLEAFGRNDPDVSEFFTKATKPK
jgi:acylphosphatase